MQRGFSLLEVLVALAILAAVLAIAVPQLTGKSSVELKATAYSVAAGLRRTRDEAMSANEPRVMAIDVAGRFFRAGEGSTVRRMPPGIEVSLYTARSEVTGESLGAIRFFPDGSSTGGQVSLAAEGRRFVIDIDWLTGRIKVHEDNESATGG